MKTALMVLAIAATALAQPASTSYIGAGGCASSNCHGGTRPLAESDSRILGNEYATWSVTDKHSRAYRVLEETRATRMGEILKIADVKRDRRCTVCHVVGSPEKTRTDGVACEACHGPAEKWLGPHTRPNSHTASVAAGMIDTKNLQTRARTCLACHLGAGEQVVDHELIAAGHPDLAFELDTFTYGQPSHHRDPKPAAGNTLPRVRAWAVGQAEALAGGMHLLAAHAEKSWPEFSDMECYQCHHDLRADSWRIQRGYDGRKPGSWQVNLSRFEVARELVSAAAPEQKAAFESEAARVRSAVEGNNGIAAAAQAMERTASALSLRFLAQNFDRATAEAVLKSMGADIRRIADAGVNSAEQATMTLDALGAALGRRQEAVAPLYDYLEHPSTYKPSEFATLWLRAAGE
jgi:Cytochrome c554 and c-prime